jgi:hypothetical protein
MEARMTYWHETKTKKYHDLANRIAEKGFTVRFFVFEVGCRGLVEKSLRKFLTALELPKKIIVCAITEMLPKDLPQPFIIKFRTIMVMGATSSWNADERRLFEKKLLFFK